MTLAQIEAEIEQIAGQMKPLIARTEALNRERRRLKSVAFIEANSVRIEDVEMSSGDGKPWFGTAWEFGKWLKANSDKRFCEWNETIYFTAELAEGRMDSKASGTISELSY